MNLLDFFNGPYTMDCYRDCNIKKGPKRKQYSDKNKNIEYYTDAKGNIRRRKIKWIKFY